MVTWINLCSFLLCVMSLGAFANTHPYATVSADPCVLLASWIIHVPKPLLISVEAAASLCYEPAVMWLYRDQSFLYPTSQSTFFTLRLRLSGVPPPFTSLLHFSIPSSSPSLSVSVFCVLLLRSDFIRTDTLCLLLTGFLFFPSNITPPFFFPLQPLAVKQKLTATYLWSPLSSPIFPPCSLFSPCLYVSLLTSP